MPVYKRGNIWWYRFQYKGETICESAGPGATYEQAKALESQARQAIVQGRLGQVTYTLEDAAVRWLEGEAQGLKDYEKNLNLIRIIRPYIKNTNIEKAQDAAQRIREAFSHLKPATINRRLAIVRRLCNLAWGWQWIRHPIKIELLSGEEERHVYKTVPEVIRLAKRAGRSKWHVLLAAFTGMREGEILGLNPDMAQQFILQGKIYLTNTKNGKPRAIPLNRPALLALERLDWSVTYPMLRKDFEAARGDEDLRFHDLRHTAASFMVRGGASLVAVRDVLGHSNLGVTSRYSHLNSDELQKAVDKMTNRTKTVQSAKTKKRQYG